MRSHCLGPVLVLAVCCAHGVGVARAETPVAPGTARMDGVAAIVGEGKALEERRVILRSDVELRARAKLTGEVGRAVLGVLPESLLAATLDELIGEHLLAREAVRLGLAQPSAAAVRQQRKALGRSAGGESRLRELAVAMGVGARELAKIARRRAIVQGFLEANLVGSTEITRAELERAYAAGDHPFADRPLDEVGAQLRTWLGQQSMRCAVHRWVAGLRGRAQVRILVNYGAGAGLPSVPERCNVPGRGAVPGPKGSELQ